MTVSEKTNYLGVEMGVTRTNAASTITINTKWIIPTHILRIIRPIFVGITYICMIPTLRLQKISTITPTIISMELKVGGHRNHTTLTITICNTKLKTTCSTN